MSNPPSISSSAPAKKRVTVVLGSARQNGNAAGLCAWLVRALHSAAPDIDIAVVNSQTPPHTPGPLLDPVMPALVQPDAEGHYQYASPSTRQWSALVSSSSGFVFLTPQHNWGYPAELKAMLDHLYWEWKAKPALIVTYGGRGGGKCAEQLRQVIEGGLGMRVAKSEVGVKLPGEYIRASKRVKTDESEEDGWLREYDEKLRDALAEFLGLLSS